MSIPDDRAPLVEPPANIQASFGQPPAPAFAPAAAIDPNNPPWGIAAGILTWVGSVVLLILMATLFAITSIPKSILGDQEKIKQFLTTDPKAIFIQVLSFIPAHLLTLFIVWAVVTRLGKRPFWKSLGWSWGKGFGFWRSIALAIGLFLVGFLLLYFIGSVNTQFDQSVSSSRATSIVIAFLAVGTAPLVEETVYRGVLYSALHKKLGVYWAVIGVLVLFTLVHVPQYWPDFARIGVLGLLSLSLTFVRAYTGRLLPCFIIHFVFNGVQSALIIIEPYLPKSITGQEPKAPAMLISYLIHKLL